MGALAALLALTATTAAAPPAVATNQASTARSDTQVAGADVADAGITKAAAVVGFNPEIIISDALVDRPEWRPDLIPWIPVLGCQLIGFLLLNKHR